MKSMQVEVTYKPSDEPCEPACHRYFALEMIGDHDIPPSAINPLVCTQCGSLIVYKITL